MIVLFVVVVLPRFKVGHAAFNAGTTAQIGAQAHLWNHCLPGLGIVFGVLHIAYSFSSTRSADGGQSLPTYINSYFNITLLGSPEIIDLISAVTLIRHLT